MSTEKIDEKELADTIMRMSRIAKAINEKDGCREMNDVETMAALREIIESDEQATVSVVLPDGSTEELPPELQKELAEQFKDMIAQGKVRFAPGFPLKADEH